MSFLEFTQGRSTPLALEPRKMEYGFRPVLTWSTRTLRAFSLRALRWEKLRLPTQVSEGTLKVQLFSTPAAR
jgi:hypothetical protein